MKPNEASFEINVVGTTTGERYIGKFKTKLRLSNRDLLRMDALRRELLQSSVGEPSPATANIADLLASIGIHLLEEPQWFTQAARGLDLTDQEPLFAILDEIVRVKNAAHEEAQKQVELAKQALVKP